MIVRLDRLGRSLRELLTTVDDLEGRGVALVSLEEKIDTSSAAGELVFGAIAQFERPLIAERTRDGLRAARAEGRRPGRPALDRDKLDAALTLVRNGLSPTRAARQVGLGRSTLYREIAPNRTRPPIVHLIRGIPISPRLVAHARTIDAHRAARPPLRLAAGATTFATAGPSDPHCPAWPQRPGA